MKTLYRLTFDVLWGSLLLSGWALVAIIDVLGPALSRVESWIEARLL
jgi:hypothetical protein